MKYDLNTIDPKPSDQVNFDHRTLPTPAWFKPFWDKLLTQEYLEIGFRAEYRLRIEVIYTELCVLFNKYENIKDSNNQNELNILYADTLHAMSKIIGFNSLFYKKSDEVRTLYSELLAELHNFDLLVDILKRKWSSSLKPQHVFPPYIKYAIQDKCFNSSEFSLEMNAFIRNLTPGFEYADNWISERCNNSPKYTPEKSIKSTTKFVLQCIESVVFTYLEQSSLVNLSDLTILLGSLPKDVQQYMYAEILIDCILKNDLKNADLFYSLIDHNICDFTFKYNPDNKEKPYKDSDHDKVNKYLCSKDPSSENLYRWACGIRNHNFWNHKEAIPLFICAALAGHIKACEDIVHRHERYLQEAQPYALTSRTLLLILNKCVELNVKDGINLLAEFYLNGNHVPKDVPKAIKYYLQTENYSQIANIYRYHSSSIKNEYEAFKYYQLALAKCENSRHSDSNPLLVEIALSYLHGLGTTRDVNKALDIYKELAIKRKYKPAYVSLADIFRLGVEGIIPVNMELSREYYSAGENGFAGSLLCMYTQMSKAVTEYTAPVVNEENAQLLEESITTTNQQLNTSEKLKQR